MKKFLNGWFFGWANARWFLQEVNKMYSGRVDSFYSKKRVEAGIAFIVLQWGLIYYLHKHSDTMTMTDILIWAGVQCTICGYALNKIEKNNIVNQAVDLENKKEDNKQTNIENAK